MIGALIASSNAFTPPGNVPGRAVETRREMLSKVAGAAALVVGAEGASAKAGQFAKASLFGFDTSSPYVGEKVVTSSTAAGSAYKENTQSTYGFKPTGEFAAKGYTQDVAREKVVFEKTTTLLKGLQADIDSKTWWKVRDQLRGTNVYSMRSSMLALNEVLPAEKKPEATKLYKKFWVQVEALDLACVKKEQALATKKNADMVAALDAYIAAL